MNILPTNFKIDLKLFKMNFSYQAILDMEELADSGVEVPGVMEEVVVLPVVLVGVQIKEITG